MPFSLKFNPINNTIHLNGKPVSLHCHHYNCGILKAIEEIPMIDGFKMFVEASSEEFYRNFEPYLSSKSGGVSTEAALKNAAELYHLMGFGKLDLSELNENGGKAYADSSYFVVGWLAKYGRSSTPVCYLTCGFIAGILAAIFNAEPSNYEVKETECMIAGFDYCEFKVSRK